MAITSFYEFLKELCKTIEETENYLTKRMEGRKDPGTIKRLEALIKYLQRIDKNVRTKKIPSSEKRRSQSLGWILVDDWGSKRPFR